MNFKQNYKIVNIIRIILGFVFIYAALDKIFYPAKFAQVIYHYKVLPIELINIAAIIMPWLEFILGLFLIFGVWINTTSALGGIFMIIFIILMGSAMVRGLDIECGCFSLKPDASLVGWRRIIEDVFMLAGFYYLFVFGKVR